MKRLAITAASFLGGALLGYLACVWMAGYFYTPFEPSPRSFEGTAGTRYVMMCGALFAAALAYMLSDEQ